MAFDLESPAEAYAAVSLLVVGADGVSTMEERRFLFDELKELSVFSDHDAESFGSMLVGLTGRMFGDLSTEKGALSGAAIAELCAGARRVLDAEQRHELFSSAVKVAYTDGLADAERTVLDQLAEGLGLDAASAQEMIARATE